MFAYDDPSPTELARDAFLLRVLQGAAALDRSKFVKRLWFPPTSIVKTKGRENTKAKTIHGDEEDDEEIHISFDALNQPQKAAALKMVSKKELDAIVTVKGKLLLESVLFIAKIGRELCRERVY